MRSLMRVIFTGVCLSFFAGSTALFAGDKYQEIKNQEEMAKYARKTARECDARADADGGPGAPLLRDLAKLLRDMGDQHDRMAEAGRVHDPRRWEKAKSQLCDLEEKARKIKAQIDPVKGEPNRGWNSGEEKRPIEGNYATREEGGRQGGDMHRRNESRPKTSPQTASFRSEDDVRQWLDE